MSYLDWAGSEGFNLEGERIWNEEDWETFFRDQDRRAGSQNKKLKEKDPGYQEHYDSAGTSIQRKDAGAQIGVQSHWIAEKEEGAGERDYLSWEDREDEANLLDAPILPLKQLPVYQESLRIISITSQLFQELHKQKIETPELHQIELHYFQISAHIAAGYAMGFDGSGLAGNLAKLKRALKSTNTCLDALLVFKRKDFLAETVVTDFIYEYLRVRDALIHYIIQLRSLNE